MGDFAVSWLLNYTIFRVCPGECKVLDETDTKKYRPHILIRISDKFYWSFQLTSSYDSRSKKIGKSSDCFVKTKKDLPNDPCYITPNSFQTLNVSHSIDVAYYGNTIIEDVESKTNVVEMFASFFNRSDMTGTVWKCSRIPVVFDTASNSRLFTDKPVVVITSFNTGVTVNVLVSPIYCSQKSTDSIQIKYKISPATQCPNTLYTSSSFLDRFWVDANEVYTYRVGSYWIEQNMVARIPVFSAFSENPTLDESSRDLLLNRLKDKLVALLPKKGGGGESIDFHNIRDGDIDDSVPTNETMFDLTYHEDVDMGDTLYEKQLSLDFLEEDASNDNLNLSTYLEEQKAQELNLLLGKSKFV